MFMSTWGFVIRNAYNQYPDKTYKTVKEEVYVTGGPCEEDQKPEWKYKYLTEWDIFFNLLSRRPVEFGCNGKTPESVG